MEKESYSIDDILSEVKKRREEQGKSPEKGNFKQRGKGGGLSGNGY